jgi:transposase
MRRHEIKDDQWARIEHLLPGKAGDPGVTAKDNRLFINAIFWIAKTGAPWRDLPERFGKWNSVFQRFHRWSAKGVWGKVMEALAGDADLEWLLIDSTVIRAHQHAAGKKGGRLTRNSAGREVDSVPKCMSRSMPWATR